MIQNNCDSIIKSRKQHLGIIELNRPQKFNALTEPMLLAIEQQLIDWEHDNSIHAVIIMSTSHVFCAGGDIHAVYSSKGQLEKQLSVFKQEYHLNNYINKYPKPYIAWMNGITFGGGVGISLHGSHPIGTENFIFYMPETKIGFFPDVGSSYLFNRCPLNFANYLGLTGTRLNAQEAHDLNILPYVTNHENLPKFLNLLLEEDLSHDAHARVTACFNSLRIESNPIMQAQVYNYVNECFQHTSMEEIIKALQCHHTPWSEHTYKTLLGCSPTSLKVTIKQLMRSKNKTLAECLQADLSLIPHFLDGHDFYEGIHKALIDRKNKPNWQPSNINQVNGEMIENYFREA